MQVMDYHHLKDYREFRCDPGVYITTRYVVDSTSSMLQSF